MQAGQSLVQQLAPAISQERSAQLMAMHAAPSMSLSHASGTPRASSARAVRKSIAGPHVPASVAHAAGGASGELAASPSFNPSKPWQQLFRQHSKPRQQGAAAAVRDQPHFGAAAGAGCGIGTPPSVQPRAQAEAGQAMERTFSMGSLRRGALSFGSQRQPSGSVCLEPAHSNMSFAADISAELQGAAGASASIVGPARPRTSVDYGTAHAMQAASAVTARRGPVHVSGRAHAKAAIGSALPADAARGKGKDSIADAAGTHRAGERMRGTGGHRSAACNNASAPAAKSSLAQRCPPPAALQVASVSPFAEDQDDVLDRFWTSQHEMSPQPPEQPPSTGSGSAEPGIDPAGYGRLHDLPPNRQLGATYLQADRGCLSLQADHAGTKPSSSAGAAQSLTLALSAAKPTGQAEMQAVGQPGTHADAQMAAPPTHSHGGAMLHAVDAHTVDARCAARAVASHAAKQARAVAAPAHGNSMQLSKEQADRAAMPAPPRRSRGSKIAGLATIGQENRPGLQQADKSVRAAPKAAHVSRRTAPVNKASAVTDAKHKREPLRNASNQAAGGPNQPGRMACSRHASHGPRDGPGSVCGSGRPELSAAAPLCHRRALH